jgi:hypothetical protein
MKINAKIKSLGGTQTLSNTRVEKGAQQGGQDAFITFMKRPFKDRLKVIVFAPLDTTIFSIKVTCKPGPASIPLGPPKVATISKKQIAAAAAAATTAAAAQAQSNKDAEPKRKQVAIAAAVKSGSITTKVINGETKYFSTGKPVTLGQAYINFPKGQDITTSVNDSFGF